jgi:N-acetylglucosaminyl-diphospho-decaprenol L-rhamnosyltransferase
MTNATGSPDLSIIIVNWNARNLLVRCLESLLIGTTGLATETWIVDNASTDGSVDLVRSAFPGVYLIANSQNLGFAAANNQAAMKATGRYLLLLNPDTEVPPYALRSLVRYADAHPDVGVLGPRLLNHDRTHQRSCWRGYPGISMALIDALYLWKIPWIPIARLSEYHPHQLGEPRDVDHLLGACLLVRREAWQDVGPLDERYFLFLEETDWCWRAKRAGWRVVYYPHAAIIHYGQHSIRQQPASNLPHLYRGYCRFYRRHSPEYELGLSVLKAVIAFASALRIALWTVRAWRASETAAREQCRRMVAAYQQVLRELPSF